MPALLWVANKYGCPFDGVHTAGRNKLKALFEKWEAVTSHFRVGLDESNAMVRAEAVLKMTGHSNEQTFD